MVTTHSEAVFEKCSELSVARLLGEAIQQIEGLSARLDDVRAERDQLRASLVDDRPGLHAGAKKGMRLEVL